MKKIGIIGGGQASKMLILEGKKRNLCFWILDPQADCLAHSVADKHIVADTDDLDAIRHLSDCVDVITYESERVQTEVLVKAEEAGCALVPSAQTMQCLKEKQELLDHAQKSRDAKEAQKDVTWLVASACYDSTGRIQNYPIAEVTWKDGTWDELYAPARIGRTLQREADRLLKGYAEAISVCGIFYILMTLSPDGKIEARKLCAGTNGLLDFTVETCYHSQYENHLRAILGYSLGNTLYAGTLAVKHLTNLHWEGNEITGLDDICSMPGMKLHLYGKRDGEIYAQEGSLFSAARTVEDAQENLHRACRYMERN